MSTVKQRVDRIDRDREKVRLQLRKAHLALGRACQIMHDYRDQHPNGSLFGWDTEYRISRASDTVNYTITDTMPIPTEESNR